MEITIKEKLKEFIDTGDDKLLKLMFAVANEYTQGKDEFELTDEQIIELDRRREMRKSGNSKTFKWAKVKDIITDSTKNDI
jgi:hypothetical protein